MLFLSVPSPDRKPDRRRDDPYERGLQKNDKLTVGFAVGNCFCGLGDVNLHRRGSVVCPEHV